MIGQSFTNEFEYLGSSERPRPDAWETRDPYEADFEGLNGDDDEEHEEDEEEEEDLEDEDDEGDEEDDDEEEDDEEEDD